MRLQLLRFVRHRRQAHIVEVHQVNLVDGGGSEMVNVVLHGHATSQCAFEVESVASYSTSISEMAPIFSPYAMWQHG